MKLTDTPNVNVARVKQDVSPTGKSLFPGVKSIHSGYLLFRGQGRSGACCGCLPLAAGKAVVEKEEYTAALGEKRREDGGGVYARDKQADRKTPENGTGPASLPSQGGRAACLNHP